MANRGGFSWKRAVGITAAKSKISRATGIPLTKSGRQRKVGKAMGCLTMVISGSLLVITLISLILLILL